jgi:hypothetical protein
MSRIEHWLQATNGESNMDRIDWPEPKLNGVAVPVCCICLKVSSLPLRLMQWIEPFSDMDPNDPMRDLTSVLTGFICDDCYVVHWAQPIVCEQ